MRPCASVMFAFALACACSSVARAEDFTDFCNNQPHTQPWLCAVAEVHGGTVGIPDGFTAKSSPNAPDHLVGIKPGVVEMFGSGFAGEGHATAQVAFGLIGASAESTMLEVGLTNNGDPESDIDSLAFVRMEDGVLLKSKELPSGTTVHGRLILTVSGSFGSTGGGGTLDINLVSSDKTLRWSPNNLGGIPLSYRTPYPMLTQEFDFYVDEYLSLALRLYFGATVSNTQNITRKTSADLTDGIRVGFQFDDPRVTLTSLSGHDYRIAADMDVSDAGASDAGTLVAQDAGGKPHIPPPVNADAGSRANPGPSDAGAGVIGPDPMPHLPHTKQPKCSLSAPGAPSRAWPASAALTLLFVLRRARSRRQGLAQNGAHMP